VSKFQSKWTNFGEKPQTEGAKTDKTSENTGYGTYVTPCSRHIGKINREDQGQSLGVLPSPPQKQLASSSTESSTTRTKDSPRFFQGLDLAAIKQNFALAKLMREKSKNNSRRKT